MNRYVGVQDGAFHRAIPPHYGGQGWVAYPVQSFSTSSLHSVLCSSVAAAAAAASRNDARSAAVEDADGFPLGRIKQVRDAMIDSGPEWHPMRSYVHGWCG